MIRPRSHSRKLFRPRIERMEGRVLLSSIAYEVTNTNDSGAGSLRQAILNANAHPGADNIVFAIPASTAANLDVPVSGFDPVTQTWRITLDSPLPTITDQVSIDGYTQAHFPIPYRYPSQVTQTNSVQSLSVIGGPAGGTFRLQAPAPLSPGGTTVDIPFDATAATVQARLEAVVGSGNVTASGGPASVNPISITFQGDYAGQAVPALVPTNVSLVGGTNPDVSVNSITPGGTTLGDPSLITSSVNTVTATQGNTAQVRVIVDGHLTGGATGFIIDASHSILRGLAIDGFGVGVSIPSPDNVGDLIQGNFIGPHFLFLVDPTTGQALPDASRVVFSGYGNSRQGVLLDSTNATVGGTAPQDNNVITNNGLQGVSILPGAEGNQVLGNQIGLAGPSLNGRFARGSNGAEGVLVAASSNTIGGATAGAGNLISCNLSHGVRITGPTATRNNVLENFIGVGPGGGYLFGSGDPGNLGDGVRIDNAPENQIGTNDRLGNTDLGNVISANEGAGVRIIGRLATGNVVAHNTIGLTVDGLSALGNSQEGVAVFSANNQIGPDNTISANLRGVLLSGSDATGNRVRDNRIGTDPVGTADLGNAREGVRIDNAPRNTVTGDFQGSQVISGNNMGVVLIGPGATGNLIQGNLIGSDVTGLHDLGNSQEGVRIENAPANTLGGTTGTARNLISANHWGVVISGASATGNILQGNFIGTDITGLAPLGNELEGVLVQAGASVNQIGGASTAAGNTIAFNIRDGVRVEDKNSIRNAILTNSIHSNGALGINLVAGGDPLSGVTLNDPNDNDSGPNNLQNFPTLTAIATSVAFTNIQGTLQSTPNTVFTIQFFANMTLDPSGYGEGERYLGGTTVRTGANGLVAFSADVPATVPAGQYVTATATDPAGNTSEFSAGITEQIGTTQFSMSGYTVDEAAGMAVITVTRQGGSGGLFTVDYATANGTATEGTDYTATSGTLTFNMGENSKTFAVPILDDGVPEANETVLLTLSDPTGAATLGTPSSAVLAIRDNDQPGALRFSMASYVVNESDGMATITVVRDSGGGTVSVHYATADGLAQNGMDYTPTSGVLTFAPGQTSQSFTIPINDDFAAEGNETVLLTLSDPTGGATLGSPSSAVLTIQNDNRDRNGPVITRVEAVPGRRGLGAVVLTFNELLNPTTAQNLINYGYSLRTPGRDRLMRTADDLLVGLSSAVYDPATLTVTLTPNGIIHRTTPVEVIVNQATDIPGAGTGVADLAGNLLDGDGNGQPGGVFAATVSVLNLRRAPIGSAFASLWQRPTARPWAARPFGAFRQVQGVSTAGRPTLAARAAQLRVPPQRGLWLAALAARRRQG